MICVLGGVLGCGDGIRVGCGYVAMAMAMATVIDVVLDMRMGTGNYGRDWRMGTEAGAETRVGNGQWAMGNGQRATGNGQRATGNGQRAMSNEQ